MATKDYLKLRGHTWYVRVQIPPHLWAAAGGRREYVKSLKTRDLNEANKLKHAHVAALKQRIAALERNKPDPHVDVYERALAFRDAMERHKGEVLYEEGDGEPYYASEEFLSQLSEQAKELLDTHGATVADSFYKIGKGEGTLVKPQVEPWLTEITGTVQGQTISQHRVAVERFLDWAGGGALIEDVSRRRAGEFVGVLLDVGSGLSRGTAKRYVSSLSSFWKWLKRRGLAEFNPWLDQGISERSKRGGAVGRKQWTDSALAKVLKGSFTPDYELVLHDLTRLALVTGGRLGELCELKAGDVEKRADGYWINIREGKTKAAVREVPVHDSAAHVLRRRLKNSSGYLFDGLSPGGPDNKRSWYVTKAFGRYTRTLDLGEDRQVFHALRNTFAEAMEAAEVPLSTVKLIIGHRRADMTFGHYSKGERVELRKSIDKLKYPKEIMRLIRADMSGAKSGNTSKARG
jgi:integrase